MAAPKSKALKLAEKARWQRSCSRAAQPKTAPQVRTVPPVMGRADYTRSCATLDGRRDPHPVRSDVCKPLSRREAKRQRSTLHAANLAHNLARKAG